MSDMQKADAVDSAELKPVDKLKAIFEEATASVIAYMEKDLALSKAMGDQEETVKHYIKIGMLKHTQEIFNTAYTLATRPEQPENDLRERLASGKFPQNRSIR